MLETADIPATVIFYTQVLGFTPENYTEDMGWVYLKKDGVTIMFSVPNEHRNIGRAVMSGSLYFNTDNVDQVWDKLKEKCNICYPIEDFEYGMREFAVYDNNWYLLQFGQEIDDNL